MIIHTGELVTLPAGIDLSDCPLPCEIYSTETKLTLSGADTNPGFSLSFQQNVEVKIESFSQKHFCVCHTYR